jgi:hypothetical protein
MDCEDVVTISDCSDDPLFLKGNVGGHHDGSDDMACRPYGAGEGYEREVND